MLSPSIRQVIHALLTRPPLKQESLGFILFPFDLHVLSTPPAFILSQDQTLMLYDCFIFGQNQLLANFFREFKSDSPISRFLFPKLCFTVLGRSFEFSFVSFRFTLLEFSGLYYCSVIKVLLFVFALFTVSCPTGNFDIISCASCKVKKFF